MANYKPDKPYSEAFTPEEQYNIVMPDGTRAVVSGDRAQELVLTQGARLETPEETHEAGIRAEAEEHPTQAFIESAGSMVTGGLTDILAHGDEKMAARRKYNPSASFAGALTGMIVPGYSEVAGAIGKGVGALVKPATMVGRLGQAAARYGAEGVAWGLAEGTSHLGLDPKPLDIENISTTLATEALYGGGFGALAGVGGKLLEEGASAARSRATKAIEEIKGPDAAKTVNRGDYPEFAQLDVKATKAEIAAEEKAIKAARSQAIEEAGVLRKDELDLLQKTRDSEVEAFYKEADRFKQEMVRPSFFATSDKEIAKQLKKARLEIMSGLDNPKRFLAQRGSHKFLEGLQKQELALSKLIEDLHGRDLANKSDEMLKGLPDINFTKDNYLTPEQANWYREWKGEGFEFPKNEAFGAESALPGRKAPKKDPLKAAAISGDELSDFRRAIANGDFVHPDIKRLEVAQEMLEHNLAFQEGIAKLREPLASENLVKIDKLIDDAKAGLTPTDRLDALKAHLSDIQDRPLGKRIAGGMAAAGGALAGGGIGGPMGAVAGGFVGREIGEAAYDKIFRKMASRVKANESAITNALNGFFGKTIDKIGKAAKNYTPVASKILQSIRYVHKEYVDSELGHTPEPKERDKVVAAFRQRAREINALTDRNPDGTYSVKPRAREMVGQRLQGVWAVNDKLANGLELLTHRKMEFLASKLPRNPAPPTLPAGPDLWRPSRAEIAKFARYVDAVENPVHIVERMRTGEITPEDAEVLKVVYPAMYDDIKVRIHENLGQLQKVLPYQKRLSLSIMLDVALDPALTPEAVTVYQNLFEPPKPPQGNPVPKGPKSEAQFTPGQRMSEA